MFAQFQFNLEAQGDIMENNRQTFKTAFANPKELKTGNWSGRLRLDSGFCIGMLALLFFLLLGSTPALHAQLTGTISGTVYDSAGSVVAGAQVTLRNEATDEKRDSVTNGDGVFAFPSLLIGSYSVEIQSDPDRHPAKRRRIAQAHRPESRSGRNYGNRHSSGKLADHRHR
jgi:hypothetical protein